jgi:hypothetical protein
VIVAVAILRSRRGIRSSVVENLHSQDYRGPPAAGLHTPT